MEMYALKKKNEEEIKQIADEVVRKLVANENLKIEKVIIYGSYARGDAEDGSDLDIMVLCDNEQQQLDEHWDELWAMADDIGYENDILIQTKIKTCSFYDQWIDTLPFLQNVRDEGIVVYG